MMNKAIITACLGILVCTSATPAVAEEPESVRVTWKKGLSLETADKAFRIRIGGSLMNDWASLVSPDDALEAEVGTLEDGTEFRYAEPEGEVVAFSARPEAHLAPPFADTGEIEAARLSLVGAEIALVAGPFSVQAEFVQAFPEASTGYTYSGLYGGYGFVSWFVTGESRRYRRSEGEFGRVDPEENRKGDSAPSSWRCGTPTSISRTGPHGSSAADSTPSPWVRTGT